MNGLEKRKENYRHTPYQYCEGHISTRAMLETKCNRKNHRIVTLTKCQLVEGIITILESDRFDENTVSNLQGIDSNYSTPSVLR